MAVFSGNVDVSGALRVVQNNVFVDVLDLLKTYQFTAANASTTWEITHDLGTTVPSITCFDNEGNLLIGSPDYSTATENSIVINFAVPVSGTAIVKI